MQTLIEHISCLAAPHEFHEATKLYSEVYTPVSDGYLKHVKLRGDRFARVKVKKLPVVSATALQKDIEEELNFLPDGKIPYSFFEQIVQFFRQVISIKKVNLEAHAWILWSKETGYYISIPPQTVSGASVKFEYTKEALPEGHTIVVDIHSHNGMGAFYSGTDNNNDKSGIYYSGVIGKLTEDSYEYVMRFNLYEDKMSCELGDVFDIPKVEYPEVPKDWLDKVNTISMVPKAQTPSQYSQSLENMSRSSLRDNRVHHWQDWVKSDPLYGAYGFDSTDVTNEDFGFNEISINPKTGLIEVKQDEYVQGPLDEEPEIFTKDPIEDGEYAYNASQYGVEIADAKYTIETELIDLQGEDEVLVDLIREIYSMLSESGRSQLQTNGM